MCNTCYKVEIVSIEASDADALTDVQKKINQWITIGILAKYEIHTTSTHVIFNICRKKSETDKPKAVTKQATESIAPF